MKRGLSAQITANKNKVVECSVCQLRMRSDVLTRHLKTHNPTNSCRFCSKQIRIDKLLKHETLCKDNVDERLCDRTGVGYIGTSACSSSVSGYFRSYELNVPKTKDYDQILIDSCLHATSLLKELLKNGALKSQLIIALKFFKENASGRQTSDKTFRSICEPLLIGDDVDKLMNRAKIYIRARIEEYERHGSGWIFQELQCVHLEVAKYCPLSASGSIDIPQKLKNMKSLLNINSNDGRCFLYCLLSKLFPVKEHPERYTKYLDHVDRIDMGGVKFPIKISDISKIEAINNLSISVFEWNEEDNCVDPLKHGSDVGIPIELLYIENDKNAHYLLIKKFNAFMRHRTKYRNSMFYCLKCLHGFTAKENLREHSQRCKQGLYQKIQMPEHEKASISFKAYHKQERKLFVIYADSESLLLPIQHCQTDPQKSSTIKYQKHVACSFSIVTKSVFEDFEEETIVYANEDPNNVTVTFLTELNRVYDKMMDCYSNNQYPISMTDDDEKLFKSSKNCHICKKKLQWSSKKNFPVRDHDHTKIKNNFRGAACNTCNRNYFERTKKVPVIFHNLKSYDMNIFLLNIIKSSEKIDIIPENLEKFKTLLTEKFIFLDSYQFLSTSLEKLVKNLKNKGTDSFRRLKVEFPDKYNELTEKGVYFYDYASSYSVFNETEFPPKSDFYNQITEENIDDKTYNRGLQVFKNFNCKTLLDYMLLYVKTDSILLCDVFENFRDLCLEYYGLDPCHYFSLPGFGWDAMLKMTQVEIELMSNIDMYTFIEQNLRGGITTINHRHFIANNKYLDDFDSTQPSSYIMYIDANNLYGVGLSSKMPIMNFRWLTESEIASLSILNTDPDGDLCYILEVDLHYPDTLHDDHNCYPLAVESKFIEEADLSTFNRKFLQKHKQKFKTTRKLCPDLKDKENYVCSLKNLQFYLRHGLQLKKVHRVLTAYQTAFMKPFIDFNTNKRTRASSTFEKDLFKLMNNSCYGKTIEDLRKRSNVQVVKDQKRAKKLTSRPQHKGFQILDDEVTLVQSMKGIVSLNKPIACGFTVLEASKYHMMWFWYDILKRKYGPKIKLLISDTDSFVYAVYTNDGYQDLVDLEEYMDLSGYAKDSIFYRPDNKKVIGKFSDEKPKEIIKESINLKPKMYSLLTKKLECDEIEDDPDHKCKDTCFIGHSSTAKGIPRVAQKCISHEDYRTVLQCHSTTMAKARTIRSFNHNLFSIVINKRGLSCYDDKKYVLDDGVRTLAYGHYNLRNIC